MAGNEAGMAEPTTQEWGFTGGSDGKESAYNAGDPVLIPGSGRSPGDGNGNSLQYFCHPPQKRAQRDISEKAMAPHSSTLAWKIPWTEEPGKLQSLGSRRVGHD